MTEESSSAYDELDSQLDKDYPTSVVLDDENPKFIGKFQRVDWGPSDYGQVPIAVFEGRDGKEYGLWMFHAVLRNQFAQRKPRVGDIVGVRFLGKKTGASGRQYSNYKVAVHGEQDAVDFDWSVLADAEANQDLAPASESPGEVPAASTW